MLDCGHDYIRQVLHGRWKIVLLLRISDGIVRPGELARSIPQATRRVLDVQLGELVRHGLLKKTVYDDTVKHVEFSLTPLGESLMPVIAVMGDRGNDHLEQLRGSVKQSKQKERNCFYYGVIDINNYFLFLLTAFFLTINPGITTVFVDLTLIKST